MATKTLATGVSNVGHISVFDDIMQARFEDINIPAVLVNLIDIVEASALSTIADQFNVAGSKGWELCRNDDERREVIKKAISFYRFAGTPGAIIEALKRAGFYDATIVKGLGRFLDGSWDLDGTYMLSPGNWATFKVVYDLGNTKGVSAEQTVLITALINEFKRECTVLTELDFVKTCTDEIIITEEFSYSITT